MARQTSNKTSNGDVPIISHEAVLKPSAQVPEGVPAVSGIEFNNYKSKNITAIELVSKMTNMGFQAGAVAEAARIINDMVILILTEPIYW